MEEKTLDKYESSKQHFPNLTGGRAVKVETHFPKFHSQNKGGGGGVRSSLAMSPRFLGFFHIPKERRCQFKEAKKGGEIAKNSFGGVYLVKESKLRTLHRAVPFGSA